MENIEIIKILFGITAISIALFKGIKIFKTENPKFIGLFGIWFFGLLAFLFGLLGYILQMINVFDNVAMAGEISPSIIADGMSKSSNGIVSGILILILSIILWGIVKTIKNSQIRKKMIE